LRRGSARIGIAGCGQAASYLKHAPSFGLEIVAVADADPTQGQELSARFGVRHARNASDLLRDEEVEVVLDLSPAAPQATLAEAALGAGKHVYSERLLALAGPQGQQLIQAARAQGVKLGSAPDTFLGPGIQTCRSLIDSGAIGTPITGAAFLFSQPQDRRSWETIAEAGVAEGGPLFELGPSYLTALITLLGPIKRVSAAMATSVPEPMLSQRRGFRGATQIGAGTHLVGTLEFAGGPIVSLFMSMAVWATNLPFLEIYGSEGTISGPNPGSFGGPVHLWQPDHREWAEAVLRPLPWPPITGLGLAEFAHAIKEGRSPRTSAELAYHVLDVMCTLVESAEIGQHITLGSTCDRPPAL
jgi:predicted dehydrogenase